jgi:phosphoserine phosphatase
MTAAAQPRARKDGYTAVVFDCDSTLSRIEGIDELGGDRIEEIRALTDAAMDGSIPLEEVYGRRLAIIQPTRERVEALGRLYIERLVEDARETVAALLWLGKDVRIISGGLRPPVEVLAIELGIPRASVRAVGIDFDESGGYSGFEADSLLARNGGKPRVVREWSLPRPALLIGDGATDLEARSEVDLFAAYMGVVFREKVAAAADLVLSEESLAPALALAAGTADRERLRQSRWEGLLARGDALLRTPQ